MAWHMTGQLIEACTCKAACPCVLGPAEPDQGGCSGALTFVIQQGESDGVNVGGRKVLWLIDLPKDFLSATVPAASTLTTRPTLAKSESWRQSSPARRVVPARSSAAW